MNRSNSIALDVLVQYYKMDFFKAMELIQSRVPICTIISTNIVALTKLFKVKFPRLLRTVLLVDIFPV